MPRLAVYVVPPADTLLYQLASAILGYDVFAEREVSRPSALRRIMPNLDEWIGGANHYGFHATIGDALIYKEEDIPLLEQKIAKIAASTAPFHLTNGRVHTTFREFPRVLVTTFDSEDRRVQRLEDQIVTRINVRHKASPHFAREVEKYSDLQHSNFIRYGSPNVRSLFDLHFTLAVRLPNTEAWRRLADCVTDDLGLFSAPEQREWTVDTLYLLEEKPDNFFRIRNAYRLSGAPG